MKTMHKYHMTCGLQNSENIDKSAAEEECIEDTEDRCAAREEESAAEEGKGGRDDSEDRPEGRGGKKSS